MLYLIAGRRLWGSIPSLWHHPIVLLQIFSILVPRFKEISVIGRFFWKNVHTAIPNEPCMELGRDIPVHRIVAASVPNGRTRRV